MRPLRERAIVFECATDRLVGVLHEPETGSPAVGVLIVVGGPQYRAGSHRQFVLTARALAAAGYPVLRFDHRGIGDSDGAARSFDELDEDVRTALDALHSRVPSLRGSVIYGLCDAASAALIYSGRDPRLLGLVLVNPWVHSEAGSARAYVKHYYLARLGQASFWRKVAAGEFQVRVSVSDFIAKLWRARRSGTPSSIIRGSFRERMLRGLKGFEGPVLVQISGRDLTAAEFMDLCGSDPGWRAALGRPNVRVCRYDEADHTFATPGTLESAVADLRGWVAALPVR